MRKNDSATALAIRLLDRNRSLEPGSPAAIVADAGVFFGDTKAAVFWASIGRERGGLDLIPGVKRPPLVLTMPTFGGRRKVYLDAGVSVDNVTAEMLWQFAWLGWAFAQVELGIAEPRVALHSNGEEPEKGDTLTKQAFTLFSKQNFPGFLGHNAQMTDLISNEVDVLVSEGFGGNKSFKSVEAGVRLVLESLKRLLKSKLIFKILARLLKPCFTRVKAELDSSEFGCQPLLGIDDAIVGIGHGSADQIAVAKGIEKAMHFAEIELSKRVLELVSEKLTARSTQEKE
jgi:glycerol-3-phosphate acyltransferase PlsX